MLKFLKIVSAIILVYLLLGVVCRIALIRVTNDGWCSYTVGQDHIEQSPSIEPRDWIMPEGAEFNKVREYTLVSGIFIYAFPIGMMEYMIRQTDHKDPALIADLNALAAKHSLPEGAIIQDSDLSFSSPYTFIDDELVELKPHP